MKAGNIVLLFLLTLLGACGGGGPTDPPPPSLGSIQIQALPEEVADLAAWTLSEPDSGSQSGSGVATLEDMPTGAYSLQWEDLEGWITPSASQGNLAANDTLLLTATYLPDPDPVTQSAWLLFEAGSFAEALLMFEEALGMDADYAEAHHGLGWCQLLLGNLSEAVEAYSAARAAGLNTADPLVGEALALRDLEPVDFPAAIEAAEAALLLQPDYDFVHDEQLDWHDLRLVIAQSQVALGEYLLALDEVILLGGVAPDPGSETFLEDLLSEIQRLESLYGS
ncbi:MAG: tetratricopeptide repeat protein [Candidatus Krumholzibacteria bacterium]|nr:tetratricopeptide repeat protein [Candidatus Krumholzibacteria bacterium]MDP6669430.1 tetratricopeptide repeat protein [Candidatus Krumholzibacteria bacterium]MDP6796895.1 tetratricopeptide repeat protein [Candidatus Krumholzibacteria bacterium]MDP7021627.1 tetratricopeptide repeat protein [Candidatus Krumholzibacteria bacterium]